MKKPTLKSVIRDFEKHRAVVAKERDRLRDLQLEVEQLNEDCDEALGALEDAIDALSRLV
jgi:hypothetical protein